MTRKSPHPEPPGRENQPDRGDVISPTNTSLMHVPNRVPNSAIPTHSNQH